MRLQINSAYSFIKWSAAHLPSLTPIFNHIVQINSSAQFKSLALLIVAFAIVFAKRWSCLGPRNCRALRFLIQFPVIL